VEKYENFGAQLLDMHPFDHFLDQRLRWEYDEWFAILDAVGTAFDNPSGSKLGLLGAI